MSQEKKPKKFQTIHSAFTAQVRRHPFRLCMADNAGRRYNYVQVLVSVIHICANAFHRFSLSLKKERVGILIPSSCIHTIVSLAVLFSDKVPVNLNIRTSNEKIQSLAEQYDMRRIFTTKKFLETSRLKKTPEMILLDEESLLEPSFKKKLSSFLIVLLPSFLTKLLFMKNPFASSGDTATVIFSSGTTGEPKGVVLSHRNVMATVEGLRQVLKPKANDRILAGIPTQQALGFSGCFAFPLASGMGVIYHSNLLDTDSVAELVRSFKVTLFFGIPLLFSAYVRKCSKEDFASLDCAVAGTEKLRRNVTKEFYQKFDVVPFLSYGSAEVSGILTIGMPDYIQNEALQYRGSKPPRVGEPLPGVLLKVVNPEDFKEVSTDQEGLLLVKSQNVMKGYLNHPELAEQTMHEGWYVTQDIARQQEEGQFHIIDRHSRFSRIGSETIPHGEVEEEILEALGASEQICVVTSVISEAGEEKLVVLYEHDVNVDGLREKLLQRGKLPVSWVPKEGCYYEIPDIPYLESGKLALIKIKERARLMEQVHVAGEDFVEVTIETEDNELIALNHFRRGSKKVVILAHGWRNSKDTYLFKKMSGMFSLDYDVICIDFRGHGRSSGTFMWTTTEDKDLTAVIAYARRNDYEKIALMGFSLGGAIAIIEASKNHDIDSVIAVSAPIEFGKIDFHFWEPEMLNDIRLIMGPKGRGRDIRAGNPLIEKIRPIDVVHKISPTPILFLHGDRDWLIKPYHSEELYKKAKEPKKLVMIPGAGHADKIYDTSSREFEQACYDWLKETL